jgi:hypothetical protein
MPRPKKWVSGRAGLEHAWQVNAYKWKKRDRDKSRETRKLGMVVEEGDEPRTKAKVPKTPDRSNAFNLKSFGDSGYWESLQRESSSSSSAQQQQQQQQQQQR